MDNKQKIIFDAMVSLVKSSRVKDYDNFKWDKNDCNRLVMLIIQSNKTICDSHSSLLNFLTQCDMMTHNMLSSLLSSQKLNLNDIFSYILHNNISKNHKLKLFLKLVEDDTYEINKNNIEQV